MEKMHYLGCIDVELAAMVHYPSWLMEGKEVVEEVHWDKELKKIVVDS